LTRPYISFVTFTRNDDYAGGLTKLRWGLTYLAEQCDGAGLDAEAVIVEWNPPIERPPLAEALSGLPPSTSLSIRVITVPSSAHRTYRHAQLRPIHGAVAANVGLRRARGDFALIKVADAYYADALVAKLARRTLDPRRLYRAVRHDVAASVAQFLGQPRPQFLARCRQNIELSNEHLSQPWVPFRLPNLFTNASGDFQLLSRERWHALRGYWETADVLSFEVDSMLSYSAFAAGLIEELIANDPVLYKIAHSRSHSARVTGGETPFSKFMLSAEQFMNRRRHSSLFTFGMRAIFNYPPKIYGGVRKQVYERSLVRFKLLAAMPWLTRMKSADWGLAQQSLRESTLNRGTWDCAATS